MDHLEDGDGRYWYRTLPSGVQILQIDWQAEILDNSREMDSIVDGAAAKWQSLARQLTLGPRSSKRAFADHNIARFEEEQGSDRRCRCMLMAWLNMSMDHNTGALYKGLYASGMGLLADKVLATRLAVPEGLGCEADRYALRHHGNSSDGANYITEETSRDRVSSLPSYEESQRSLSTSSSGPSSISSMSLDSLSHNIQGGGVVGPIADASPHGGPKPVISQDSLSCPQSEVQLVDTHQAVSSSMRRLSSLNESTTSSSSSSSSMFAPNMSSLVEVPVFASSQSSLDASRNSTSSDTFMASDTQPMHSTPLSASSSGLQLPSEPTALRSAAHGVELGTSVSAGITDGCRWKNISSMSDWDIDVLTPQLEDILSTSEQHMLANGLLCPLLSVRSGRAEVEREMGQVDGSFIKTLLKLWRDHCQTASGLQIYDVLMIVARQKAEECKAFLQV